jgi:hypothetical protein
MLFFQGMTADAALVCNHNWAGSRVMQQNSQGKLSN